MTETEKKTTMNIKTRAPHDWEKNDYEWEGREREKKKTKETHL